MNENDVLVEQAKVLCEACGTIFDGQRTTLVGAALSALMGEWLRHFDQEAREGLATHMLAYALFWIEERDKEERKEARERARRARVRL